MKAKKMMCLGLGALLLSACLGAASAVAPAEEYAPAASASAVSTDYVTVQQENGFFGSPSNVTVEVNSTAEAAANTDGSGESSATVSSSTTVTVTTGESGGSFAPLPVPPPSYPSYPAYPADPSYYSSGSRSSKSVESIVKTISVSGTAQTVKGKVNLRALPSTRASRVTVIQNKGTAMEVLEEVLNSASETWYAVKLYNGYMGYILGSLLDADLEYPPEETPAIQYIYITPEPVAEATPEVIYVPMGAAAAPTPSPIILYVTPEPAETPAPLIVYATPEPYGLEDDSDYNG